MGRTAVYLVVGLSVIFLYFGLQMYDVKFQSLSNSVKYFENAQRMNIAQAGANFACTAIFNDTTWKAGYTDIDFNGGKFSVSVKDTVLSKYGKVRKIFVTGKYQAGTVDEVTGRKLDSVKNIIIYMRPSSFSQFGYYSGNDPEGISWITGDTVWGPFHSNTYIYVEGAPVFMGKATVRYDVDTTEKVWKVIKDIGDPQFNGGFEKNVNITLPTDLKSVRDSAAASTGELYSATAANDTAWVTIINDSIKIQRKLAGTTTTSLITNLTQNGVIGFEGYTVRAKGTLDGKLTLASLPKKISGTNYGGGVILDDDVKYANDPSDDATTGVASDDVMGIVAENDIIIADNTANSSDVIIQAALFSRTGGLAAQNHSSRGVDGDIKLLGGISQSQRKAVGTHSGGVITNGFQKKYKYDDRLAYISPPVFPATGVFQILSWFE